MATLQNTVESISVGQLEALEVPAEDVTASGPGGADVDFTLQMKPTIRRPDQFELFGLVPGLQLTTRLLSVRSTAGGIETTYYYVSEALRGPLFRSIRDVEVLPWWSFRDKKWNLWVVSYNPDSTWYASLQPLLQQSAEFYEGAAFTVVSDTSRARYCVRKHVAPGAFPAPGRPVTQLLGQAIGPANFISSVDHPVYQKLIAGEEV